MKKKTVTVPPEVDAVFARSTFNGNTMSLPDGLERGLYTKVMKHVELNGGKWNRAKKCHVFPSDAAALMKSTVEDGVTVDMKKTRQAFYTPATLAEQAAGFLDCSGHSVLEPSAGGGALVDAALKAGASMIVCFEIDEQAVEDLRRKYKSATDVFIRQGDYLAEDHGKFSRILMNPPYDRGLWKKHLDCACDHLMEDGVIVAITPQIRYTRPGFVVRVEVSHTGAFKSEGTSIATWIVSIRHK